MKSLVLILLTALLVTGCSVVSKQTMRQVDTSINLEAVQSKPDLYTGRNVLWGGIILSSENKETTTEIEVLETELAYDETPKDGTSRGRFIVEANRFLDTNIYKENKRITVAGTVKRVEVRKIGKMDYPYPVIAPIEMRVFEQPVYREYGPYYPYGPYGPYSPYYPSPWPYPMGPYPMGPYRYPFPSHPYPYPFPY